MDNDVIQKLAKEFPEQFDAEGTPCWSSISEDWIEPVRLAMQKVKESGVKLKWAQIKEKFGYLRMYPSFEEIEKDHENVHSIIQEAENAVIQIVRISENEN